MNHLLWLWLWFGLGMFTYWLKRAYFMISPPNQVANSYWQLIKRAWVPLFVRSMLDGVIYWLLFTPSFITKGLAAMGWSAYADEVALATSVAPVAFFFGHTIDSLVDMIVVRFKFLQAIVPQMPGPLPQQALLDKDK